MVKQGDTIALSTKMGKNAAEPAEGEEILPFLEKTKANGKLARLPKREDVHVPFDTQLIIEYYSR